MFGQAFGGMNRGMGGGQQPQGRGMGPSPNMMRGRGMFGGPQRGVPQQMPMPQFGGGMGGKIGKAMGKIGGMFGGGFPNFNPGAMGGGGMMQPHVMPRSPMQPPDQPMQQQDVAQTQGGPPSDFIPGGRFGGGIGPSRMMGIRAPDPRFESMYRGMGMQF